MARTQAEVDQQMERELRRQERILDLLTGHERTAIATGLRAAVDIYRDAADVARRQPLGSGRRLAEQFDRQATEALDIIAWMED